MKKENYGMLIHENTESFKIQRFYENNPDGLAKRYVTGYGTVFEEAACSKGSWFVSLSTGTGSCFSVYKEFGPTGLICCKWVTFRNGGAVVGTRYTFDPSGKPVSAEDEEEGFSFTPHQVLQFCEENKIDLFSENTCIERFIERPEKMFYYIIHYKGEYKGNSGIITMILNGRDGISERVILHYRDRPGEIIYEREKQS